MPVIVAGVSGLEVQIKNRKEVVAVQSLDGQATEESDKILITLVSRVKPSVRKGKPFLSEPVTGRIKVKAQAGMEFVAVTNKGEKRIDSSAVSYENGFYNIQLTEKGFMSHWYYLRKD